MIEVIPRQGAYYDNNPGDSPNTIEGYSYYYFDQNGDGQHNVVFIAQTNGDEIKAVGFDYDGDGYFLPFKTQLVERHIIGKESSSDVSDSFADYAEHKYGDNGLINFNDHENHEGVFLEPTFRDSLFDLWKSQYTGSTRDLMDQIKSLTVHSFLETLTFDKVLGDLGGQLDAISCGLTAGTLLSGTLSAFAPGIGTAIGFGVGFFVGYLARTLAQQQDKQRAINYYIASQTFHNEDFDTSQTLSSKWWNDEYFGDIMPNTLQGSSRGVYTPVKIETDKHAYEGQIVLAPRGIDKTTGLDGIIKRISLDYSQQTRSYMAYSDFDDEFDRLTPFLFPLVPVEVHDEKEGMVTELRVVPRTSDALYSQNSIMYVENAIDRATIANKDDHYNKIIPYMVGPYPSLIFADSGGSTVIPEFYMDHPIMVSSDEYGSLQYEYHSIFKIFDGSSDAIQLIPENNSHQLQSRIFGFEAFFVSSVQNGDSLGVFTDCYTFDNTTGILTLDPDTYTFFTESLAGYNDAYYVFDFKIEKYRDISDTSTSSSLQNSRIATMQSIQASILGYIYEVTIAQKTQERLNEIAYTVFITAVSTVISMGISSGANVLGGVITKAMTGMTAAQISGSLSASLSQSFLSSALTKGLAAKITTSLFKVTAAMVSETYEELYIDPWIEAYVSKAVRDTGGNAWEQVFWSSFAQSGRETGLSLVTSTIGASVMQSQAEVSQTLHITPQESIMGLHQAYADARAQRTDALTDSIKNTVVSSLLVFAGTTLGGAFGSVGGSFANLMIPIGIGLETGSDLREALEASLKSKYSQVPDSINIHSEVSDARKSQLVRVIEIKKELGIETLSESQKSSKISEWMQKHKASIKTVAFVAMGIAISTFAGVFNPLLGSVVSVGFTMGTMKNYFKDNTWEDITNDLYVRNKENNELIIKICINAINQLYASIKRNIPYKLRKDYDFHSLSSVVGNINAGNRKIIASKKIQRMMDGALRAVENHIINEDNELLEILHTYKKLSLALDNMNRLNHLDKSSSGVIIPQRVSLFEKLRTLLKYQDMFGHEGFTMPMRKFGKLINQNTKDFLSVNSRVDFSKLLEINFRILDLSLKDLKSIGLDYSYSQLRTFKRKASLIIEEFILANPFSIPYINKEDIKISEKEGIDYIGHKFRLIRSIGYVLYKLQHSTKFKASKTPFINFRDLTYFYLNEPRTISELKVTRLLEILGDPVDFNQKDFYLKQTINELNKYKDTFAKISATVVGKYTHVLEELAVLTSLILDKDITVFHESTVKDGRHVTDLSIQVDSNFRNKYSNLFMQKYQIDLSKIDTVNIDFTDSYKGSGSDFIKKKFFKNYQSQSSVSLVILTNHMLYDKTRAKTYIDSFDPYLDALAQNYYPQHIKLDTIEDFISFFEIKDISKGLTPLTDLNYIRRLKDEALSRNPGVSNRAFENLYDLYSKAKLTLALVKNDPAAAAQILRTKQLNIAKFLGDPSKKIDEFL